MHKTTPVASVQAAGDQIGRLAEKHLDATFRKILRRASIVAESGFLRLQTAEEHPLGNIVLVSEPEDLDATIMALGPLCSSTVPAAVLYPAPQVGEEVDAFLRSHGFDNHGAMPAMAVDIEALPRCELPSGYAFVRVGDGAEGEDWAKAFAQGYEIPIGVARLFSPGSVGFDPERDAAVQFFAVYKGYRFVSTVMLHLDDGLAGIYCVATIPEERGRGLGAHVTVEALRAAYRLGYRVGVLQASDAGHSLYRRLGFIDVGGVPLYMRIPS